MAFEEPLYGPVRNLSSVVIGILFVLIIYVFLKAMFRYKSSNQKARTVRRERRR